MKTLNTNQLDVMSKIRGTKGKFFGLYTKQGQVYNAQFLGESKCYVNIFDRNGYQDRRIAKSSLQRVNG